MKIAFAAFLPNNKNTSRQYVATFSQLAAEPEIVGMLKDYFAQVPDRNPNGFSPRAGLGW